MTKRRLWLRRGTAPATTGSESTKKAATRAAGGRGRGKTSGKARAKGKGQPSSDLRAKRTDAKLVASTARATRTTKRSTASRPPGRLRTIKAPDPRQRARRTIRVRTSRIASRFSAGQPRRRLITTLVVMLLILSAVLVKVGMLQTVEGDSLRSAASEQWTRDRPLRAPRGTIFDRDGEELALSVPATTIAVNPRQVEDPEGTAATFAEILGLSRDRQDELEAAMVAKDRGFVYVARQVDDDVAQQLAALRLAGVSTYREDRRILPGGDTARSVIGRTDIDGVGTAGLEKQFDNVLTGTAGEMTLEVAPGGRSIAGSEQVVQEPIAGNDIVLSIDRSVQYAAEQALLKRVAETRRPRRPGHRDGYQDRRGHRHGVGAHQRFGRLRDHVRQLLGRRRLRAGVGGQGHHDLRCPQRRHGDAGDDLCRAVAEGLHQQRRPAARLAHARRRER